MVYDALGRLARTKRRDDCLAASAGDRQEYVYDSEGLVTEIDTYDAASTLTRKQPMTYFASRRLQSLVNPVDPTKATTLVYDAGGMIAEVDGAAGLSKTTYAINNDRRITAENRYKTSTTYDTWSLLYDWLGEQSTVTDGDNKATQSVRDDLGRVVKLVSPDLAFPTLRIYDAASRLTSVVEAFGGGASQQRPTPSPTTPSAACRPRTSPAPARPRARLTPRSSASTTRRRPAPVPSAPAVIARPGAWPMSKSA
jgi:YD repeat-containing protein